MRSGGKLHRRGQLGLEARLHEAARVEVGKAGIGKQRLAHGRRQRLLATVEEPLGGEGLVGETAIERASLETVDSPRLPAIVARELTEVEVPATTVGAGHGGPQRPRLSNANVAHRAGASDPVLDERHGGLEAVGSGRAARDQVDHAEERARAVHHRAGAPDDLDSLHVAQVRTTVESGKRLPEQIVIQRLPRPVESGSCCRSRSCARILSLPRSCRSGRPSDTDHGFPAAPLRSSGIASPRAPASR